ncbi:hypothetical protein [Thioalkalivibrio sp.]|uniref:hypothetical protein n=1 Tax=Thioalkalivibrio sp. TaxID=2093813 RepID=UPI00356742B2
MRYVACIGWITVALWMLAILRGAEVTAAGATVAIVYAIAIAVVTVTHHIDKAVDQLQRNPP